MNRLGIHVTLQTLAAIRNLISLCLFIPRIADAAARARFGVAGIVAARPVNPALDTLRAWLAALEQGLGRDDREAIYRVLRDAVPGFRKEAV